MMPGIEFGVTLFAVPGKDQENEKEFPNESTTRNCRSRA